MEHYRENYSDHVNAGHHCHLPLQLPFRGQRVIECCLPYLHYLKQRYSSDFSQLLEFVECCLFTRTAGPTDQDAFLILLETARIADRFLAYSRRLKVRPRRSYHHVHPLRMEVSVFLESHGIDTRGLELLKILGVADSYENTKRFLREHHVDPGVPRRFLTLELILDLVL